ncbi:putative methyltransferase-domain-containing protein [Gorgonomyces haynaldii]|nr:putative methyltransferase-domain-containing protein [Gorgonomyces haynaldii]
MQVFLRQVGQLTPVHKISIPSIDSDQLLAFIQELKPSYQRKLIKRILEQEDLEELYEYYTEILETKDGNTSVKKYYCGRWIKIVEDNADISQGTTGLKTWQASLLLLSYLLEYPDTIKQKRVLELGSGCGLVGFYANLVSDCVMTDGNHLVLDRIRQNAQLNGLDPQIQVLDWSAPQKIGCDLILAADVVYDPDLIPLLVQTLKAQQAPCLLAHTLRRQETLDLFLSCLKQHQMQHKIIHFDNNHFYCPEQSPILLFEISILPNPTTTSSTSNP